jgi:hypothetical protein
MSDLSLFYMQNVETNIIEEFEVSPRFKKKEKGKDGAETEVIVKWQLQAITEEENEMLRKSATKKSRGNGGQTVVETDQNEYVSKLAVASVVFPNLKDAELQKSYGVLGAENLIRKMLLSGEYGNLLLKVQQLNGYDVGVNDLVEEAKN